VVIKGGHVLQSEGKVIDVLFHRGKITHVSAERHETKDTHGTGCSFSSAIAAELAKGKGIKEAVEIAKKFVNRAIKYGLRLGMGHGPLNPMASLYDDAERYKVLENVSMAVRMLENSPQLRVLVPEVQMNIGMALPHALDPSDVVAVDGRISRTSYGVRATGCPGFGVSSHVAKTILAVMNFDREKRAAINLKYSQETVDAFRKLNQIISYYDRREEPPEIREKEGMTTFWGASEAVKRAGRVPDVIYHLGDQGKEPIITLLGRTAVDVAEKAVMVSSLL
jgi:hydroxymethylpyrimidine/phosphomethylpyrimidine kinase